MTKNLTSGQYRTTLSSYIFATKARIDNRKKSLLNSNISPTCPYNMVNFGLLVAQIVSLVWGTQVNFNRFLRLGSCTALQQWASAKLCGIGQRAPPIFVRVAITLGIDPHCSLSFSKMFAFSANSYVFAVFCLKILWHCSIRFACSKYSGDLDVLIYFIFSLKC